MLLLSGLLGACSKTAAPVQLDFVGAAGLTSGNATVGSNDTLTTRAYARGNDNQLTRLRITVTYEPGLNPILYPVPISSFDPNAAPGPQTIVYLDSLITPLLDASSNPPRGGEHLFINRFSARATSGTELWQYTVSDNAGGSATRAYRLTVRKADSAAVFHSYSLSLRPRATANSGTASRVFLSLGTGLLLPKYSVLSKQFQADLWPNQRLVDLVCMVGSNGLTLEAPAHIRPRTEQWPNPRVTRLRRTSVSADDFDKALTVNDFSSAFNGGQLFANSLDSLTTGALNKNQVVAFKTTEGKAGLLLVSDAVLGTSPVLTCRVKVQK
ncbi:hypothetical protein [Hymenobacter montanus]|uniref:hypothetical protein n=1 Tax=Hymenobacter montanus TaxID=2771359 RepID=UPI00168BCB78|nr:hypothetical protein [Hymenobacter montanus]